MNYLFRFTRLYYPNWLLILLFLFGTITLITGNLILKDILTGYFIGMFVALIFISLTAQSE